MTAIETEAGVTEESSVNAAFDELCTYYYQAWFRFNPERAVEAGVYDYTGLLTSYEHDDIGALIVLDQKMLSALDEIAYNRLDARRQLDYRVLKGAINIELHDLEENDWRYRDPVNYVPVNAIYQLLIHPGQHVSQGMKQRIEQIPDYLRGVRLMLSTHPERVVPQWTESAIEVCKGGAVFVRDLASHPQIGAIFASPERLQSLFDAAATALVDFAHYLEDEVLPQAEGKFASGSYRFNRVLHEQHFLPLETQQLLDFGERLAGQTEQALLQQSEKLCGQKDIALALKKVQTKHPAANILLDSYRQAMQGAYQWLQKAGLVTLPAEQSLKVLATPDFMRCLIPFAAYEPPVPGDEKQRGLYYVSTPDSPEQLAEHDNYSIELTSVHEGFPGHHLQFVVANQLHKTNPVRLLNCSAGLYEGWALYCEQLVFEQGLYNTDEHEFIMLRDRLWRALRVIIDVGIHTGRMSFDEAVQLLVDKLGFAPEQARAEVSWYTRAATTPLCYAVGREMILQAREQLGIEGNEALRDFHDKLLSQGSVALPLVLEAVFGDELLQDVVAKAFYK